MLLDAVIALVILISAFVGYKNGFIRTIFKSCRIKGKTRDIKSDIPIREQIKTIANEG